MGRWDEPGPRRSDLGRLVWRYHASVAQPTGGTRTVRTFARSDLKPAVATLARAFDDDPIMQWIFPEERMRRRLLPRFFAVTIRSTSSRHEGSEVVVENGSVLGCAMWVPPGAWRPSGWQQVASLPAFAWALRSRFAVAGRAYESMLQVHPHRPHWYLAGIGTDPPVQGSGVGSALMRSRLERCDADGLPAYLESSKESNVPFYRGHGFSVTRELTIPGGGPTLWLMWREPRGRTA
jgi:ribosomal protein S18 acetylase RimI-like enzyme